MGGLSTAEKNRRKRERKKREKEERRQQEQQEKELDGEEKKEEEEEVEIEYVAESLPTIDVLPPAEEPVKQPQQREDSSVPDGLPPAMGGNAEVAAAAANENDPEEDIGAILRRFNQRAAVAAVVTDDERRAEEMAGKALSEEDDDEYDDEEDDDDDKKPMSKRKLREMTRPTVADLKRRVTRPDLVEAHDITAADPDFLIHLKAVTGTVAVPRHWGRKRKYLQGKRGFEKPPFQVGSLI
jgi:splicing factor 3B subunit 2